MAEEQSQTQETTPPVAAAPAPLANDPTARNPDGSLKNLLAEPTSKTDPDSKPEGEAKPDGEKKPEEKAVAPEKYETFAAPEGYEIDPALVEKATPLFKELGLTQEQAQKLVDFQAAYSLEAMEAPQKTWDEYNTKSRAEVVSDPKLGDGIGDLKPEVKQRINAAIDSLPADVAKAFREDMTTTGAGNRISFIRAFDALAQKLPREGSLVSARGPSAAGQVAPGSGPKTAAQAIFPNLPSAR